jgi:hypothetical protein
MRLQIITLNIFFKFRIVFEQIYKNIFTKYYLGLKGIMIGSMSSLEQFDEFVLFCVALYVSISSVVQETSDTNNKQMIAIE